MAAKDRRLYARLDIGFDEHDKIYPLSDAAFRAIVEATLYARRQLTDGFLAERLAVKKWGADVLDELTQNDPERPSLVRVEGGWQIHDFAEHQTTNADIEAKRSAGAKGGRAKAERHSSNGVAGARGVPEQNGSTTLAKTETETETETETDTKTEAEIKNPPNPPRGETVSKRGTRIEHDWNPSAELIEQMRAECPGVNLEGEHRVFIDYWIAQPGSKGVKLDWDATWRNWMRRKANDKPRHLQAVPSKAERAWDFVNSLEGSDGSENGGYGARADLELR